jgi:hypothetical protein
VYQLNQAELDEAECDRRARRVLQLPKDVPDHIRKGFKRQEILDILGTIALTAFHSQQEGIIEWSKKLSQRVIDEACEGLDEPARRDQLRRDLVARSIRIDCSRIDMWIQLGGPIDGRKRTHLETLGEVRALLDKNFSAFQCVTEGMSSERSDFSKGRMEALEDVLKVESLARLGAWMRLKAREAQLVFLTEGREGALAVYRNLTHIEHIAARYEGNDDPIVLSGRTARRYIRVLLHSDKNKSVSREEIDEARRIIEVNISRLRRFSGAERVGVLMDMARRHVAEGNLERALRVAQNAYERAFAGSISHGGKIDVLGLLCEVWLRSIRHRSDKARGGPSLELFDELDTIADYTELMCNLSVALDYHPARAFGRYLSAWCQVERIRLDGSATRKEITEIRTIVTQALKAMKTHGEVIYETQMEDLKQRLSNAANAVISTGRSDVSAFL